MSLDKYRGATQTRVFFLNASVAVNMTSFSCVQYSSTDIALAKAVLII